MQSVKQVLEKHNNQWLADIDNQKNKTATKPFWEVKMRVKKPTRKLFT